MNKCVEVLANFSDVGWSHFGFYSSVDSACRIAQRQLIEVQGIEKKNIEIREHELSNTITVLHPMIWG